MFQKPGAEGLQVSLLNVLELIKSFEQSILHKPCSVLSKLNPHHFLCQMFYHAKWKNDHEFFSPHATPSECCADRCPYCRLLLISS